jgi:formylglycine-generating enzyme required for sulfatase activity
MVLIPAGTYMRGDHFGEGWSGELPVHQVTLNSFYMGATEVTQKEWSDIMGSNPASGYGVGDNYPVYNVSWYSMIKYCNLRSMAEGLNPAYTINSSTNPADWGTVPTSSNATWDAVICNFSANGYRLPTEAEWEYAARGGLEGQRFPNGATISHSTNGDTQANYYASTSSYSYDVSPTEGYHPDYNGTSSPVGIFPPNGYGLYDMSGNLWEWCWDWWHYYTTDAQVNPTGPDMPTDGSYRVLRGGSWDSNASYCRVSRRDYAYPPGSYGGVGFRIVRTP